MKRVLILSIITALTCQNVAYASRVDDIVDNNVAAANSDLQKTQSALAAADKALADVEQGIANLQDRGEYARYATIGLAGAGLALGAVAYAGSKIGDGDLGVLILYASVPAALSSISHVIYSLQRKDMNKEQVVSEIEKAQVLLSQAQSATSNNLAAVRIENLQTSLSSLSNEVKNNSSGSFWRTTANVLTGASAVITALGVSGHGTGLSINAYIAGAVLADVASVPSLISVVTDKNKEQILEKIEQTRKSVAQASTALAR